VNIYFIANKSALMRVVGILSLLCAASFSLPAMSAPWGLVPAPPYKLENCLIYVTNSIVLRGPATVEADPNAAGSVDRPFRSDLCAQGFIQIGGSKNTSAPDGADTIKDVALIAPKVFLRRFGRISEVVCQGANCLDISGSPTTGPAVLSTALNPGADFPAFPTFPAIAVPGGTPDVTVPNGGTVSLPPGTYGRLTLNKDGTVNFTGSGTYTFKSIEAGLSSHLNFAQDDVILRVEEWMHIAEFSVFNPDGRVNIVVFVAGTDGKYGGLNGNKDGVTNNVPAAFGYDGDGALIACFVYVPNGTMNLKGHVRSLTQFFGKDFQQISGISLTIAHPQQICFNVLSVSCTFISRISCGPATNNKLVVNGDLLTPSSGFDKLAIWSLPDVSNINGLHPASNAKVFMRGPDPNTGFTIVGPGVGDVLTTNASTPFGLTKNQTYYVGLIGSVTGNPGVMQSFYVYTGQHLVIDGNGDCSVLR
jgi:hypothetical protein